MTYREPDGEQEVQCARCGTMVAAREALYSEAGRLVCPGCHGGAQVKHVEQQVADEAATSRRMDVVLYNPRLMLFGGLALIFGFLALVDFALEPVSRMIRGRSPLPVTASAQALPWPDGVRVEVHAPRGSTAEVLGHRAQTDYDRVATVTIPRNEAEQVHTPDLRVTCTPPPDDREYRAETVHVTMPRLSERPAGR